MTFSLRKKIFILSLLPVLLSVLLSADLVRRAVVERNELDIAEEKVNILNVISNLISALEKERGTAFLYSEKKSNLEFYKAAIKTVDTEWDNFVVQLSKLENSKDYISTLDSSKNSLEHLRNNTESRNYPQRTIFDQYTIAINSILETTSLITQSDTSSAAGILATLLSYEKAKENASRTQALISFTFSANGAIAYSDVVELLKAYSGVIVNIEAYQSRWSMDSKMAYSEIISNAQWLKVQSGVITINRLYATGSYNQDGFAFYTNTKDVTQTIQKIIDIEHKESKLWFSDAKINLDRELILYTAMTGLALIVVIILSLTMISGIVRRIENVSTGMKEVCSGDADLTKSIKSKQKDELGKLAGYFNDFISMLRTLIHEVKTEAKRLNTSMQSLSANTEETASAIRQISTNIENLKMQTINQSSSVTESASTIEEIARNIDSLYKLIARQSESVSTSSSSIEEMLANIKSVTASIEKMGEHYQDLINNSSSGRNAIETVAKQVRQIDAQSEYLQEANSLIAGISAQTNLLAMNAAIEAAHAGDAGAGFAVVADEIRKLAESSAIQSKKITTNIKEIRTLIAAVVRSSGTSAKIFDNIFDKIQLLSRLEDEIKYAMQEQSSGSSLILTSLMDMNSVTSEVKDSAQEMKNGSVTVLNEMKSLIQLTSELTSGMAEMATGAEEIRRAAQDTSNLTITAAESVEILANETDKFTT